MQQDWISEQISEGKDNQEHPLLEWWYRLAATPEWPPTASFARQETARKMRSLSLAVLTIWGIFILFIPGCFVLPNHYVIFADFGMMPICLIALLINKYGERPVLAGALVTFFFEVALAAVVLTSWPLDEPSLQQYELFVLGEIMALTLVSPKGMILVGLCNSIFITLDLIFQPHTAMLNHDLGIQFAAIWVRPVSLQIMVAIVVSAHSHNLLKMTRRANRAEMIASIEHQRAELQRKEKEEKEQLQKSIEHIITQYAQATNKHQIVKFPIQSYPAVLWPLINALNALQNRLQHARETQNDLQKLQNAITNTTECMQQGKAFPTQTGTMLDTLLFTLTKVRR